jgi:PPP family 3-phenylpropionic acid transporter
VLRWQEGGIGPGTAGLLWSEGVLAEVIVFVVVGPTLLRWLRPAGAAALPVGLWYGRNARISLK